jgi:hydroxymethylbilane synthase
MSRPLRIGTRGSPLALAQAHMVADALRASHGWAEDAIEIVPITTTGDVIQDRPLAEVGGKALWTKELDGALVEGRTDLSVHSMKDVETIRPETLVIAAMLERADTRDRLIGADSLDALPKGARIGTSSPRRTAQLLMSRPDFRCAVMRGNVQTRLAKIAAGEFDATLLAAAGLERLGLDVGVPLDMLSAPGQGAIGVEARVGDDALLKTLAAIDHRPTHLCVTAERAFLAALGGDCHSAVACNAVFCEGTAELSTKLSLGAQIYLPDGTEQQRGHILFAPDAASPAYLADALLGRASPALRAMFGR